MVHYGGSTTSNASGHQSSIVGTPQWEDMYPWEMVNMRIAGSNQHSITVLLEDTRLSIRSQAVQSLGPSGAGDRELPHQSCCGWYCQRGLCPGSPLQRPRLGRGRRGMALVPDRSEELGFLPLVLGVVFHCAGWLGGARLSCPARVLLRLVSHRVHIPDVLWQRHFPAFPSNIGCYLPACLGLLGMSVSVVSAGSLPPSSLSTELRVQGPRVPGGASLHPLDPLLLLR